MEGGRPMKGGRGGEASYGGGNLLSNVASASSTLHCLVSRGIY